MQRKWLVAIVGAVLAIAALSALYGGGVVGRSLVGSPQSTTPTRTSTAPPVPDTVSFKDTLTDVQIAYPSTWQRRLPKDQGIRILVSTPDKTASVSVSVRKSGLEPVTAQTLPVVRPLTDDLLRADKRITSISDPVAVTVGGLPGYRYRYTYKAAGGIEGAHDHYFLFATGRLVQIVMQAEPSTGLPALQPAFDRIAGSFAIRH